MICEILVLLVNTLVADDKYSFCNGEYHPQPIEMQLSKKQKTFSEVFLKVWSLRQILNISKKKMTLIADVFPKLENAKNAVSEMSKETRFGTLCNSKHAKGPETPPKSAWQYFYHFSITLKEIKLENISLRDM